MSPSVSFAFLDLVTGLSAQYPRVKPKENKVPRSRLNVLRVTGARQSPASQLSTSLVEISDNLRSGKSRQNRLMRNRRSLQYRALSPRDFRFSISSFIATVSGTDRFVASR